MERMGMPTKTSNLGLGYRVMKDGFGGNPWTFLELTWTTHNSHNSQVEIGCPAMSLDLTKLWLIWSDQTSTEKLANATAEPRKSPAQRHCATVPKDSPLTSIWWPPVHTGTWHNHSRDQAGSLWADSQLIHERDKCASALGLDVVNVAHTSPTKPNVAS